MNFRKILSVLTAILVYTLSLITTLIGISLVTRYLQENFSFLNFFLGILGAYILYPAFLHWKQAIEDLF